MFFPESQDQPCLQSRPHLALASSKESAGASGCDGVGSSPLLSASSENTDKGERFGRFRANAKATDGGRLSVMAYQDELPRDVGGETASRSSKGRPRADVQPATLVRTKREASKGASLAQSTQPIAVNGSWHGSFTLWLFRHQTLLTMASPKPPVERDDNVPSWSSCNCAWKHPEKSDG